MTKKIAVLGAGANDAAIGADLTRTGDDVSLSTLAAMCARGKASWHQLTRNRSPRSYRASEIVGGGDE
jgi:hypothetical protein